MNLKSHHQWSADGKVYNGRESSEKSYFFTPTELMTAYVVEKVLKKQKQKKRNMTGAAKQHEMGWENITESGNA